MSYYVNATDETYPYYKDGTFKNSQVRYDPDIDTIISTVAIQAPTASFFLGQDVSIENNGGFSTNKNQITLEKKLLIGRTWDDAGTDELISIVHLDAEQEDIFQPTFSEEFTLTGDDRLSFVFIQLVDAFNTFQIFKGTKGLLTFDLFVAKNPNDDDTLTNLQLINLPAKEKIQLVNGLFDFIRNPIDPDTGDPIDGGTGNANFWDFDDPNGENGDIRNDKLFYKSAVDYAIGRKLIIEWYSADGNETKVLGVSAPVTNVFIECVV